MTPTVDDWQRVGAALRARVAELLLTQAEVIRRSGVSDKTLAGYMAGKPIVRRDKRRDLALALEWPGNAIDRLLAGEDPATFGSSGDDAPGLPERVARLEEAAGKIPAIEEAVASIRSELGALRQIASGGTRPSAHGPTGANR